MKKIIPILLLFGIVVACETTTEIIYPTTDLTITVIDDVGNQLVGAEVRLYDQLETYERAKNEGAAGLEIRTDLTNADGQVLYEDLDHELDYYFFVNFRDRSRFLDFQNFKSQFKVSNLTIGSKTAAIITLEKADNIVGWYTLENNIDQLPITLFLEGDSIGQLLETVQSAPENPNSSGTLSFRVKSGLTNWRAQSQNGCVWSGEFNILGTEGFELEPLEFCESGSISFWTGPSNFTKLPITVVVESVDNFGIISDTLSTAPVRCFLPGSLSGSREKGVYRYVASSADGSCLWTGEFDTTASACIVIEFESCEP